mgnify:CR=1 FL=1
MGSGRGSSLSSPLPLLTVLLRLSFEINIPKQKSSTRQLCFLLPSEKKSGLPIGPSLVKGSNIKSDKNPTEDWGQVLRQALGEGGENEALVVALVRPEINNCKGNSNNNHYCFKSYQPPNSSSTTAGMPFVNCYLGVNDGALYPLKEGLLFYKPPRFLPRSQLISIACGRGGGGGDSSSRYVDMVIQCENDENEQETEIGRAHV